jgi:hypothetical protein
MRDDHHGIDRFPYGNRMVIPDGTPTSQVEQRLANIERLLSQILDRLS